MVNPFIYGFFSREFRTVILRDLRKIRLLRAANATHQSGHHHYSY